MKVIGFLKHYLNLLEGKHLIFAIPRKRSGRKDNVADLPSVEAFGPLRRFVVFPKPLQDASPVFDRFMWELPEQIPEDSCIMWFHISATGKRYQGIVSAGKLEIGTNLVFVSPSDHQTEWQGLCGTARQYQMT